MLNFSSFAICWNHLKTINILQVHECNYTLHMLFIYIIKHTHMYHMYTYNCEKLSGKTYIVYNLNKYSVIKFMEIISKI